MAENDDEVLEEAPNVKSAPADRAEAGPLDESEASAAKPYVDLGGVKVVPRPGLDMRLEVEESSGRVIAVALDYAESTLQVQPFAAPRSTGLWHEVRAQLAQQVSGQGGRTTERSGPFGPELVAELPPADGKKGQNRVVRFLGIDGPRWLLRAVISGLAASDADAAAKVEDLLRSIVVVRGRTPMPPRDLIALKMPSMPGATDGSRA